MPDNNPVDPNFARIETILSDSTKQRAAEVEKFNAVQEEIKVRLERVEKAKAAQTLSGEPTVRLPLGAITRGLVTGDWSGNEKVRDVGAEAKRDLSVGTASAGGYAVAPIYRPDLIDMLTAKSVLNLAGVTQISGIKGKSFTVPKLTGGSTFAYFAENGAITASDPTFDQVQATPHIGAARLKMSRLLADNSEPAVEQMARNMLTRDGGLFMDSTGLFGTGASSEPTGLINDASVPQAAVNGAVTLDQLHDLVSAVEAANGVVNLATTGFLMHPTDWGRIRKIKGTTNDHYIVNPDPTSAVKRTLFGYPVYLTSQIEGDAGTTTERVILFGDYSQLWHLVWNDFVIEATTTGGDAFANHQLWLKCVFADDWKVAQPNAFKFLYSIF